MIFSVAGNEKEGTSQWRGAKLTCSCGVALITQMEVAPSQSRFSRQSEN